MPPRRDAGAGHFLIHSFSRADRAVSLLKQTAIRLAYALALLLAVVVLNFTLIHIAPGDIADTIAGDMGGATEEVMARIRADYGLDKPFIVQLRGCKLWCTDNGC